MDTRLASRIQRPDRAQWATSNRCCLRRAAGAPRKTSLREVLNAIFYVLSTGCAGPLYRMILPREPSGTIFTSGVVAGSGSRSMTAPCRVREAAGKEANPAPAVSTARPLKRLAPAANGVTTQAKRSRGSSGTSWWTRWGCCWPLWCTRRTFRTVMVPSWSSPRRSSWVRGPGWSDLGRRWLRGKLIAWVPPSAMGLGDRETQ